LLKNGKLSKKSEQGKRENVYIATNKGFWAQLLPPATGQNFKQMHTGYWLLCRSATFYYWKYFGQNFKQQICGSFLCAQFSSEKFKRTLHPSAEKLHH